MRRIILFALALSACSGIVERNPATENLTQLKDEPIGCKFLYRLEVDALVYNQEDAIVYLENRIVDQARKGNAYWLVSIRTSAKEFKLFGEDRSYIITANVYNCPNHANIVTKSDVKDSSDYLLHDWGER